MFLFFFSLNSAVITMLSYICWQCYTVYSDNRSVCNDLVYCFVSSSPHRRLCFHRMLVCALFLVIDSVFTIGRTATWHQCRVKVFEGPRQWTFIGAPVPFFPTVPVRCTGHSDSIPSGHTRPYYPKIRWHWNWVDTWGPGITSLYAIQSRLWITKMEAED